MLSAEPKAEADNTYWDLDYLVYHKPESNNCFIIHCFEENNDKRTIARKLNYIDIGIRIHALCLQCTD